MMTIAGIEILTSPYLPTSRREQFRFPRSKRKRIQKKWRKQARNWRDVDCTNTIYLISGRRFIHPSGYALIKNLLRGDPGRGD